MTDGPSPGPLPPALRALGVVVPVLRPGLEPAYPEGLTREQLEFWAEQGLLRRAHQETCKTCPTCGSVHLLLREGCRACASTDLLVQDLIYHFDCAQVFAVPDALDVAARCPKCHQRVDLQGGHFEPSGRLYRCQACQAQTAEPRRTFACLHCHAVFDVEQATALRLYAYRPAQG